MKTTHSITFRNSTRMDSISASSVDLIVSSPPYPMIKMWDEMFCNQNSSINNAFKSGENDKAFELMHKELDQVWNEIYRVLKDGGIACINIGDATRTINGDFCLYSNHSRILHYLLSIGFKALPNILWRKQTNAPNKFMGSGMLPAGAYVTLEHEFILIVRKNSKREFTKEEEKRKRRESAIFWEERNLWFSDVWMDIKGTTQELGNRNTRLRSAAYPFEIAYRLINMFSVKGDIVLDPFLGTGTTTVAAIASGRNSIGFEIDSSLLDTIHDMKKNIVVFSNEYIQNRINKHIDFVKNRLKKKGPLKYTNHYYGFPVMTNQEKDIIFNDLKNIKEATDNVFEVSYLEEPQTMFCKDWVDELRLNDSEIFSNKNYSTKKNQRSLIKKQTDENIQQKLFY